MPDTAAKILMVLAGGLDTGFEIVRLASTEGSLRRIGVPETPQVLASQTQVSPSEQDVLTSFFHGVATESVAQEFLESAFQRHLTLVTTLAPSTDPESWARLKAISKKVGCELRILYWLRHPVSYYSRIHDNAIVSGQGKEGASMLVREAEYLPVGFLRQLKAIYQDDSELKVLPFQADWEIFLAELAATGFCIEGDTVPSQNRLKSLGFVLSPVQSDVLSELTGTLSVEILTAIYNKMSEASVRSSGVNPNVAADAADKHFDAASWIAKHCLGMGGWKMPENDDLDRFLTDDEVLISAFPEIISRAVFNATIQLCSRLRSIGDGAKQTSYEGLPPGFDPLAYLICNPDLLMADVDPVNHAVQSLVSDGRPYQFAHDDPRLEALQIRHKRMSEALSRMNRHMVMDRQLVDQGEVRLDEANARLASLAKELEDLVDALADPLGTEFYAMEAGKLKCQEYVAISLAVLIDKYKK